MHIDFFWRTNLTSYRNEKKKINQEFLTAAKYGDQNLCAEFLDKKRGDLKADVNCKGENDWTPLHFCCLNGNAGLVELLVFNEGNIEAETTLKFTPLIIACQKGHKEIAQLLINAGADINSADIYNNTPLHYCSQYGSYPQKNPFLNNNDLRIQKSCRVAPSKA